MARYHESKRRAQRQEFFQNRISAKTAATLAAAEQRQKQEAAMQHWRTEDNAKKADKRARALALARELKAKKVAENFELSSKGGRVNAGEQRAKDKAAAKAADMAAGLERAERDKQRKYAQIRKMVFEAKVKDENQRQRNKMVENRAKQKARKMYDEKVVKTHEEVAMLDELEQEITRMKAAEIREQGEEQIANYKRMHSYATRQQKQQALARLNKAQSPDKWPSSPHRNGKANSVKFESSEERSESTLKDRPCSSSLSETGDKRASFYAERTIAMASGTPLSPEHRLSRARTSTSMLAGTQLGQGISENPG